MALSARGLDMDGESEPKSLPAHSAEETRLHLLKQIEYRISKLTRFDPPEVHLAQVSSGSADGVLAFEYNVRVERREENRKGLSGSGLRITRGDDSRAENEEIRRFRDAQDRLLEDFSREQEGSLVPAFKPGGFSTTHEFAYFSFPCVNCSRTGRQQCYLCQGLGQVSCDNCSGAGRTRCSICHGTAMVTETCMACGGTGSRYESVTETVWNHQTNTTEYRTNNVSRPCSSCYGSPTKSVTCRSCQGGTMSCTKCGTTGRMNCGTCSGSGRMICGVCDGLLGTHSQYTLSSSVAEARSLILERPPKGHWLHGFLATETLNLVAHWVALPRELGNGRLKLERSISVPYASARVSLGSETVDVRAIGQNLELCDCGAIGDVVLAPELAEKPSVADIQKAKIDLGLLIESEINRRALESCCTASLASSLESTALSFAAVTDRFVSEHHVVRLFEAASSLVVGAFSRAHRIGALVAFLLAAISTVALVALGRLDAGPKIPVWTPLLMALAVGLAAETVVRLRGPLGIRLGHGVPASALLRRSSARAWAWRLSYAAIGLAFVAVALRMSASS